MNFLSKTSNIQRSAVIWNAVSACLTSFQTMLLLMVLTHFGTSEHSSYFVMAYTAANLLMHLGKFGMRQYQVTDVREVFTFRQYVSSRVCSLAVMVVALALSAVSAATFSVVVGAEALLRLAPAVVLLAIHASLLASAASAFSVRFASNAASALTGLVFAASLPFVGNYYLADALSCGGSISWTYVGLAALSALPATAAFQLLGCRFVRSIG